tara:strand:- start:25651 stop:29199 length:3549 start_codon:yes stop_codon:yes gene_type:complete
MKNCIFYILLSLFSLNILAQNAYTLKSYDEEKHKQFKKIEILLHQVDFNGILKKTVLENHLEVEPISQIKQYFEYKFIQNKKWIYTKILNGELDSENINGFFEEQFSKWAKTYHLDYFQLVRQIQNHEPPKNQRKGDTPDKGAGQPCQNADFETGDGTGWVFTEGDVDSNPYGYVNVSPSSLASNQFTMMTGAGMDAVTGAFPVVNPDGGSYSLMIGDGTGVGARAAAVSQTFLVDSNSASFTYSYALVLEDPSGHTLGEKPFFKVNVYDQNGNIIPCGDYQVIATANDPDFIAYSGGYYLPWRTTFAPLDAYIGQNVTIEFIVGDCDQGGHYGYGYVDANCSPLEIMASDTVICGAPVTLTAPPGAATYQWNTGETTQSISTSTPGNYQVTLTPVTGSACSVTLDVDVYGSSDIPVAQFQSDTVCVGNPTTFTDQSYVIGTGVPNGWEWDFDNDGVIDDTSQNPTYTFPSAGSYPVLLILHTSSGCSDDTTINVVVNDLPSASFTNVIACAGSNATFTDNSTVTSGTITNWSWDFGDGNTSTQQNPSHLYTNYGTYNVQFTVSTSSGCSDDTTVSIYIPDVPVASFTATSVCEGDSTQFTDLSAVNNANIGSWYWVFGDATSSTVQNPSHLYSTQGTYQVTLIVTSDDTLGCTDDTTITVTVNPQPVADFTVNDECAYDSVKFTNNTVVNAGTLNFSWNFGDNSSLNNLPSPSHLYGNPGIYQVILDASNGSCSDSDTDTVVVYAKPIADFLNSPVCLGDTSMFTDNSSLPVSINSDTINDWNWDVDNNGIVDYSTQNTSYMYPAEGGHSATLIISTAFGCTDTITKPVTVWPLPVVDFSPTEVCLNQATQFNDLTTVSNTYTTNAIVGWSWDFDDGGNSTLQNPIYTYSSPGTYQTQLIATTNNGCVDSVTKPVTVNPLPVANFTSSDPSGCSPWCISFVDNSSISNGNIVQYIWTMGNGDTLTTQNPQYCYTNNSQSLDVYDIGMTVVSNKGCTDDTTAYSYVNVFPNPVADFTYNPNPTDIMDPTISFLDMSLGPNMWEWSFGDGDSSTIQNPVHQYADSGNYLVSLYIENQYGCKDSTEKLIRIDPYFIVYIPNTFTPDGDGRNDKFFVKGVGIVEIQYLIFDRWGNRIWEGYTLDSAWDGTYKGEVVQIDTYVYKIKVKDVFDKWHTYHGHVNVIK